jgi:hypothetical protein
MDQDLSSVNELLERRVGLMRELVHCLERAQAAVLSSDPPQLSAQTTRQQELCRELQRLAAGLTPSQVSAPTPVASSDPGSHGPDTADLIPGRVRREALLVELAEVEAQVAYLNRTYGALLRRARRTVDIFCRVLANSGVTYIPPGSQPPSAVRDSRG